MNTLYVDLETAPTHDAKAKAEIFARPEFAPLPMSAIGEIQPAGNLKDPLKIAQSIAERTDKALADLADDNRRKAFAADKAWRDTALDGWAGEIMMVGCAANEHPATVIHTIDVKEHRIESSLGGPAVISSRKVTWDEAETIREFLSEVSKLQFESGQHEVVVVGHNVRRFDIMFLWQRCIVLNIQVPSWLEKARFESKFRDGGSVIDTMELAGNTRGTPFGPGLDRVCDALGIQTKGSITGANVYDVVMAGRVDEAVEYCRDDIKRVRSVARRLVGKQPYACDLPVQPLTLSPPTEKAA
jgi:hypothetical protein